MRPFKFILWVLFIFWAISIAGRLTGYGNNLSSPFLEKNLASIVEESLNQAQGSYGIFIKNLKTGESFYLNEHQQFEAGSLYKLWVMGAIFEKINKGELQEDKIISSDVGELNRKFNIASDEAELREGELEFSISSALEQMITISHNYAAFMLDLEVGNKAIENFLKEYNLDESSFDGSPKTTASDLGKFFEKLYKGEIVDMEPSGKMVDLLSRQKVNDRIPKLLPKEIRVAHKTADIGFFEHDGGIIFTPNGDYIIVVLTETEFPQAAGETIAELSKAVYEYFK